MRRFFWIRLIIFLRQSRWGFALLALWFALGGAAFHHWDHLPLRQALLHALYLRFHPTPLSEVYAFWGEYVLFGIIISIFILEALKRYNPQEGSRMLAREMKNHIIVVGCGHLGRRLVDHLRQSASPYVLIEKDATLVDDLIRAGDPVVVDDAKQESTLIDAGVEHAHLVIITANNVETALLVTKHARERNKKASIVVRCYMDEFTEILESLGANDVISSSKSAFKEISARLALPGAAR